MIRRFLDWLLALPEYRLPYDEWKWGETQGEWDDFIEDRRRVAPWQPPSPARTAPQDRTVLRMPQQKKKRP